MLRCSKVSSGSEKRLHQIDQSECNIFCQNISNSNINLNWYKDQPFSDWYIYKPVARHATQMNWINTKVKCIVHMGLNKVKILRKPLFHSDQLKCYIQASKTDSLFLFFASLNLSTCLFIQLKLMVQC